MTEDSTENNAETLSPKSQTTLHSPKSSTFSLITIFVLNKRLPSLSSSYSYYILSIS